MPVGKSRFWRVVVALRWPALVVGLLLVGGSLTYVIAPPTGSTDTVVDFDSSELFGARDGVTQPMPSVLGLDRDVALTVLSDAGLGGAPTAFTDKPAAGPVGLVLAQSPSTGTSGVDNVDLTISTSAPTPYSIVRSSDPTIE